LHNVTFVDVGLGIHPNP